MPTSTEGQWVTLNGAHVFIENGRITKGPKEMVGHSPSDLSKHRHAGRPGFQGGEASGQTLHLKAEGRVQGVQYRANALAEAARLGLEAAVRNNPDSSIEMQVSGPPDQLAKFEEWAKKGPGGSVVTKLEPVEKPFGSLKEFAHPGEAKTHFANAQEFEQYYGFHRIKGEQGKGTSVTAAFAKPIPLPLSYVTSLPSRYKKSTYAAWDKGADPEVEQQVQLYAGELKSIHGSDVATIQITPHGHATVDEGASIIKKAVERGDKTIRVGLQFFGGGERYYHPADVMKEMEGRADADEPAKPKKPLSEAEMNRLAGLPSWWRPKPKPKGDAGPRTDPPVSEKQRRAMWAAAEGHSKLGIPKEVGEEFVKADADQEAPDNGDLTDWEVAEGVRDGEFPSPTQYGDFWLFDLRITGTGAAYRDKLDEWALRDKTDWTSPEFVKRCNGLPVIFEHPEGSALNDEEWRERAIGTVILPYRKDDEVWGIAKIFDRDAADLMQTTHISTSPGVIPPKDAKPVELEQGGQVLAEPLPLVLDHIAVCEHGVWDKDGPPEGIRLDSQQRKDETPVADVEEIEKLKKERDDAIARADSLEEELKNSRRDKRGKKDEEETEREAVEEAEKTKGEKIDDNRKDETDKEAEEEAERLAEHEREERDDKKGKKDARSDDDDDDDDDDDRKDDDDDDDDRKSKKDDDDDDDDKKRKDRKGKKDATATRSRRDGAPVHVVDPMKGVKIDAKRHDANERRIKDLESTVQRQSRMIERMAKPPSIEDRDQIAKAFHRADSVFQMVGDQTPPHMPGESPSAYRRRLADRLRKHTTTMKDVAINDSVEGIMFDLAEDKIYSEAQTNASNMTEKTPGVLREHKTMEMGKQVSRFYGDSRVWMEPFMPPNRTLIRRIADPLSGRR